MKKKEMRASPRGRWSVGENPKSADRRVMSYGCRWSFGSTHSTFTFQAHKGTRIPLPPLKTNPLQCDCTGTRDRGTVAMPRACAHIPYHSFFRYDYFSRRRDRRSTTMMTYARCSRSCGKQVNVSAIYRYSTLESSSES